MLGPQLRMPQPGALKVVHDASLAAVVDGSIRGLGRCAEPVGIVTHNATPAALASAVSVANLPSMSAIFESSAASCFVRSVVVNPPCG